MVAVAFAEPGFKDLERKMLEDETVAIGAPTLVETGMVLAGAMGSTAYATIAHLRERLGIIVIPFGEAHWEAASDGFRRFGKGRHSAGLNYGDCMSYATARVAGRPLLFVGDDFAQTDIEAA